MLQTPQYVYNKISNKTKYMARVELTCAINSLMFFRPHTFLHLSSNHSRPNWKKSILDSYAIKSLEANQLTYKEKDLYTNTQSDK